MADQTPDDQPEVPTNGTVKGQDEGLTPASEAIEQDQTLSDRDQTVSDTDQTGADTDQTAADTDQAASESDQAASDLVLGQGGDAAVLDAGRELRHRGDVQRQETARARKESASARDEAASERDQSGGGA